MHRKTHGAGFKEYDVILTVNFKEKKADSGKGVGIRLNLISGEEI